MQLRDAAEEYIRRGYLPIPLGMDAQGFPKKPITPGWTALPRERDVIMALPWDHAIGIGLVLGAPSSKLAALDIDDVGLAQAVHAAFSALPKPPRMVWTARGRLHVFAMEFQTSPSRAIKIRWDGRDIGIEFKATGTQVATAPSPGYRVANPKAPPWYLNLDKVWNELVQRVSGIELVSGSTGYPRPWRESVPRDERNKSAYIEAHRLREAGVDMASAMDFMEWHVEKHYEKGGIEWEEIEKTVLSAYRKGVVDTHFPGIKLNGTNR